MDEQSREYLRGAVEAVLFINEKPVTLDQIKTALPEVDPGEIRRAVQDLVREYEEHNRGMVILEIAGGYQMLSSPRYADTIREFFKTRVKEKLSRPALETLAIIAYRQPVSRSDIEVIRGVNSDGVTTHLMSKGLIKIVGRKEIPGRPYLYGTTKLFLEYFGLKSLRDMPKLENFPVPLPDPEQIARAHENAGDAGDEARPVAQDNGGTAVDGQKTEAFAESAPEAAGEPGPAGTVPDFSSDSGAGDDIAGSEAVEPSEAVCQTEAVSPGFQTGEAGSPVTEEAPQGVPDLKQAMESLSETETAPAVSGRLDLPQKSRLEPPGLSGDPADAQDPLPEIREGSQEKDGPSGETPSLNRPSSEDEPK